MNKNKKIMVLIGLALILTAVFAGDTIIKNWDNQYEKLEYKTIGEEEYLEIRGNTCAKELFFENACNSIGGKAELKGCDGDFYSKHAILYCRFYTCESTTSLNWKDNTLTVLSTTCKDKDEALEVGMIGDKIKEPQNDDVSQMTCTTKTGC